MGGFHALFSAPWSEKPHGHQRRRLPPPPHHGQSCCPCRGSRGSTGSSPSGESKARWWNFPGSGSGQHRLIFFSASVLMKQRRLRSFDSQQGQVGGSRHFQTGLLALVCRSCWRRSWILWRIWRIWRRTWRASSGHRGRGLFFPSAWQGSPRFGVCGEGRSHSYGNYEVSSSFLFLVLRNLSSRILVVSGILIPEAGFLEVGVPGPVPWARPDRHRLVLL